MELNRLSFDELYKYYLPKMKTASYIDGRLNEDLLQDLSITLFKVHNTYIEEYNKAKNKGYLSFNSYYWKCARRVVARYLDKNRIKQERECEYTEVY